MILTSSSIYDLTKQNFRFLPCVRTIQEHIRAVAGRYYAISIGQSLNRLKQRMRGKTNNLLAICLDDTRIISEASLDKVSSRIWGLCVNHARGVEARTAHSICRVDKLLAVNEIANQVCVIMASVVSEEQPWEVIGIVPNRNGMGQLELHSTLSHLRRKASERGFLLHSISGDGDATFLASEKRALSALTLPLASPAQTLPETMGPILFQLDELKTASDLSDACALCQDTLHGLNRILTVQKKRGIWMGERSLKICGS
jgi:hypothetical protein